MRRGSGHHGYRPIWLLQVSCNSAGPPVPGWGLGSLPVTLPVEESLTAKHAVNYWPKHAANH